MRIPGEGTRRRLEQESETAFLHVRGMHCTSCEDFIETVVASTEGLHEAEASYATFAISEA
jgi:copper chaperone CopZ